MTIYDSSWWFMTFEDGSWLLMTSCPLMPFYEDSWLFYLGLLWYTWVHLSTLGFTLVHFGGLWFTWVSLPCVSQKIYQKNMNIFDDTLNYRQNNKCWVWKDTQGLKLLHKVCVRVLWHLASLDRLLIGTFNIFLLVYKFVNIKSWANPINTKYGWISSCSN